VGVGVPHYHVRILINHEANVNPACRWASDTPSGLPGPARLDAVRSASGLLKRALFLERGSPAGFARIENPTCTS
jgi:hypothetical protein